jgi:threonine dehydrogenase-like Zn-dependent dehydrogenase
MTTDPVRLALDFDEVRDVTVIGAGPVGLCTGVLGRHA